MAVPASRTRAARITPARPLRIVTAVPLCDGHDSAITTINLEFARRGIEIIYLGYHQAASAIARAAVQEDADAVGLSSYNGGHLIFFREVLAQLKARGGADIPLFGGGGATITAADERAMQRAGVDRIFFAGTPLDTIVDTICRNYGRGSRPKNNSAVPLAHARSHQREEGDRVLARSISSAETSGIFRTQSRRLKRGKRAARGSTSSQHRAFVIGVAGPGGAGKSTLIDELTARFLRENPNRRIGILANDPTHPEWGGAILGDRVSAIYAQDDRVFFRSLATRGSLTGLSAAAPGAIDALRRSGEFDLIFVESVGVGQESDPFGSFGAGPKLVDAVLFLLAPHYGGRIQLQKIALLSGADVVALNKCDDPRATTAQAELSARLAANGKNQPLFTTIAAQHEDAGVDGLYRALLQLSGVEKPGGERPCQLQLD